MKAKQYFIPLLLCLLIIGIAIFIMNLPNRPYGDIDTMELKEIERFSEEELKNRLVGTLRENIIHSWGEPHFVSITNGQNTDSYSLTNGDKYKKITLFYDADGFIINIIVE